MVARVIPVGNLEATETLAVLAEMLARVIPVGNLEATVTGMVTLTIVAARMMSKMTRWAA
jgi:hypothetical protein